MDTEDHNELHRSSVDAKSSKANDPEARKTEDNRVSKQPEALEDAQDSPPATPTSEVYSLKDDSSDSILAETGLESELREGKVGEIDEGNVAEETKEDESDALNSNLDEPSKDSDTSTDARSSPKQEVDSLKDDLHEKSANPEPSEEDDISPESETAEKVKEVLDSASKNEEHAGLIQRNEEVEASKDPEPLMVADSSPKPDIVDVVKDVLVFDSKKEDYEGSEDSILYEDSTVIPEVENDSISLGDESDGFEDDRDNKMTEVLVFDRKKEDHEGSEDSILYNDSAVIPEVENDSISVGDESDGFEDDRDNKMTEVLVFDRKKEDHEGSEDSILHEDAMVIPEVENGSTSSADESDGFEDDHDNKMTEVLVYESKKVDHEDSKDLKLHEDAVVIPEVENGSTSSADESDDLEDDRDNKMTEVLVYDSKKEDHEGSKDLELHEDTVVIIEVENNSTSSADENGGLDDDSNNKMTEVLVYESKKEDHEGSEDSGLHKDAVVIPEIENDSTSSGDENNDLEDDPYNKTNDKTSVEPPALVEKADHANQLDGSLESRDNKRSSSESMDEDRDLLSAHLPEQDQKTKELSTQEKLQHLALDGRQVSEMNYSTADETAKPCDVHANEGNTRLESAATIKNLVQEASVGAVSSVVCHPSGSEGKEDDKQMSEGDKDSDDSIKHPGVVENSPKRSQRSFWRPLSSYFRFAQDTDQRIHADKKESVDDVLQPIPTKGRIIFYTRLGCRECKDGRLYLHANRLRYIEINVDLFPGRKLELEKMSGSSSVPKIFFNEILIGDVSDLKRMDETGKLQEKIDYIVNELPPPEAPLPPLSGEDDLSGSGSIDELAVVVRKMQDSIVVKDRFHQMRRITNCFLGSEAVDFISEDQYLQREEAVQFALKLANNLFFHQVLEENVFEDGNHLYRFLDHDPIVSTQCYNIPRGIVDVKPRPITEIASRLRFLSYAIFDAYTSEDGRHVDYRSIHGSEEFARYVRTVEQLQRVEMQGISREERLAFFINLYNMMAIHAILVLGHPTGALERRRLFVDFQYVVGGCTYSMSTIQNGILRGNQRPPYGLMKPFGSKDKRSKVALPYPEPLTHFALVCGTRSGPALRYCSPGNIDKELMDAARDFLRNGGFIYDVTSNVAYVSKILKWFSVDFGKTEVEVLKHAANYLEPAHSEMLLDLLAANQLKVIYQPYDWGLNC